MREYLANAAGRIADTIIAMRRARGDTGSIVPLPHITPGKPWWPLPNVWPGVSVEDQPTANERIPRLLDTPAARRWVSYEPALGGVDFEPWLAWPDNRSRPGTGEPFGCLQCDAPCDACPDRKAVYREDIGPRGTDGCPEWVICDRITLDWIVMGGESGPGARPMHPEWARKTRDDCAAAGVPFLFKQWGAWAPNVGAVDWCEIDDDPEISRIDHREWRNGRWSDPFRPMWCDFDDGNYDQTQCVSRVGKKAAGRILDGRTHDAWPEPAS